MKTCDVIVKDADIATAGDRYRADIGIRAGRIIAIAQDLSGQFQPCLRPREPLAYSPLAKWL